METRQELLSRILNEQSCISIDLVDDDCAIFELNGGKFELIFLNDDSFPLVLAIDCSEDYPHFLFKEIEHNGHKYRSICLFESGTIIEYIHTVEERIRLCISRLISLVGLSTNEIVEEQQKEFLYYWNLAIQTNGKHSSNIYQLFLDDEESYQWLEQQHFDNSIIRITKSGRFFNDSSKKRFCDSIPSLYLPIIDSSELSPPLPNSPWGSQEIVDIVAGVCYQRISNAAYEEIAQKSYNKKEILLVFKLNSYFFACIVEFANAGVEKLLVKFESRIINVIPIRLSRCDYEYLNRQIGNELNASKIALIGIGSLGSYIACELVKAGYKSLRLYDSDCFEFANIFRHKLPYCCVGAPKSLLATELSLSHPELDIQGESISIDKNNIDTLETANIIIITVGDSDSELRINSSLRQKGITVPVYHVWLEHDGSTSHVVAIRNQNSGCFECLYTDCNGNMCSNSINIAPKESIQYFRNGCGGTRVPYGNRTLLTATALLLTALEDKSSENRVYSYVNNQIVVNPLPQNERCHCCGIQKQFC